MSVSSRTEQVDSDAVELAELLRSLQWRLRRRAGADLGDLGITPAQGRVLRVVAHSDEPPRMGQLAEHLHIAPRSVTDLVDPLEEAGLLRREQDPGNRRSWRLLLTEAGQQVHAELRRRSRASAAAAFAVLDADERAALRTLLQRVDAGLDDDGAGAPARP
ncbi:MarR family winged helix-turn-helix transcriptional regulator [Kineococcus rubinsiae]|uniref:MarR family winged helix-turn-helix transcriptional regulator n=1 Tax=Kineococcus rubinsiae TaxID=2609562 RepID=UPI001AD905E0|nr:MarR family transcriptional regulator [Kineococcus rubinsiae]